MARYHHSPSGELPKDEHGPTDSISRFAPVRSMKGASARLLAAMLFLAACALAQAQSEPLTESTVKAAFLYKFTGYIEWPASEFAGPAAPFVVGVMRNDAVASELERLVPGRNVGGHPVLVRRLKPGEPLRGVHVLFLGGEDPDPGTVVAAEAQGTLVVTESPRGLAAGSAINFVVGAEHVGFEVSVDAALRSGHRISARMLSVARRVVQKGA